MAKRYVQHVSGQGKKWALADDGWPCNDNLEHPTWIVRADVGLHVSTFCLPKSEYVLCDPDKAWVDVTHRCQFEGNSLVYFPKEKGMPPSMIVSEGNGFRVSTSVIAVVDRNTTFLRDKAVIVVEREQEV